MSKSNAVKFKVLIKKAALKEILMETFDLDIQLKYPQLANSKDEIPIRGICLLGSFESLVGIVTPKDLSFLDKLKFQQNVNFKLIEIDQNPVELPMGAVKEVNEKPAKN